MIFELKIDCGDAQCSGDGTTIVELTEVAEILRHAAMRVSAGNLNFDIRDNNGNRIGEARFAGE